MSVDGIRWLGIKTDAFGETVEFLTRLIGPQDHGEGEMAVFKLRNGDTVEVFGPADQDHRYFTTGPVPGFAVDDIHASAADVEAAGMQLIGGVQSGGGLAWCHFRGPDGTIFELTADSGT
jgi:predicted enzyme related to lactoylglutathione lyase